MGWLIYESVLVSLLVDWVVGARCSEWASLGHGDIRVGVGCLIAHSFIEGVVGLMRMHVGIHVPSELLSRRLGVVELLLGRLLQRFKLSLKHLQLFLSVPTCCATFWESRSWVGLSGLICNSNHCDRQKEQLVCWFKICNDF